MNQVKNKNLFKCTCRFVERLVPPIIKDYVDGRSFPPSYSKVPYFSSSNNGFPSIHISEYYNSVVCPSNCFGKEDYKLIIEDYEEYIEYVECITSTEEAMDYFNVTENSSDVFLNHFIKQWILEILDSYMYKYDGEFNEQRLEKFYILKESVFYMDTYPIDIAIPILFMKFEVDSFDIAENIQVYKMDDHFQLGRMLKRSYVPAVPEIVMSSATHCVLLKNYVVHLENQLSLGNISSNKNAYPLDIINLVFSLLRLVSKSSTGGYSQILTIEKGWANHLV